MDADALGSVRLVDGSLGLVYVEVDHGRTYWCGIRLRVLETALGLPRLQRYAS